MDWPLYWRLPNPNIATNAPAGTQRLGAEHSGIDLVNSDEILDRFLDFVASKSLTLYPAQEEAILALYSGKNVILNTPTGSGKSLVALALHFQSLANGRKSYYTCPIKALVNEKFRDLCADFGPDQVGMITGDGSVNPQAPIICCTAEILANLALREGEHAHVQDVIMDEFHYYSDKARGAAWQIPLLTLPQTRFLLMSATLGEMDFFARTMTGLNGRETEMIRSADRPVPLDFEYRESPLSITVADLIGQGKFPIYLVNFSQREAAEEAQNLLSVDFSSKEEKKKINEALQGFKFDSPYGKDLQRILKHGIGLHHAGLLPKYRMLTEKLAQAGLLKVISGTDTLGVGVNVPIRTVLFTKLAKYDGEKSGILSVREFHQISGRAGRRGFDTHGTVVAQAPEHVIENLKMKNKAEGDPKKMRKLVTKTAPPGFIMWSKETFQKLINSLPEPLVSRFQMNHAILLNVLGRPQGGPRALQTLIRRSHGTATHKKTLRKQAFELFRSLLERKIVGIAKDSAGRPNVSVNVDLQSDFSLNQALSLYLLDAIQVLNRQNPDYALDVLTLAESILENPELILRKQLDRVKSLRMNEMKAAGIPFEERIEELDKLEYPKPLRDFIYETFNAFAGAHPWVGQENIRPKSIAREMYENFYSFGEYIREYDLQRAEGILLRYLSETYKVLEQTVPDDAKDEEIHAIAVYFGSMIRMVDSSLLENWEKMREEGSVASAGGKIDASVVPDVDVTQPRKAWMRLLRNEVHKFVRALSVHDFDEAAELVNHPGVAGAKIWSVQELEQILREYEKDHSRILTDAEARNPKHTHIQETQDSWLIQQVLIDADAHNDWEVTLQLHLKDTQTQRRPVLSFLRLNEIGSLDG